MIGAGHAEAAALSAETLILALFHAVLAPATALHALLYKRDPRAAFGWIAVCLLFPLGGPVLYLFFGLNRARVRAQRLGQKQLIGFERGEPTDTDPTLSVAQSADHPNLTRIGDVLSRHPLTAGHAVDMLVNGEAAYPAMLAAIDRAREHVLLSTYLIDRDSTGRAFRAALSEAARRGVEVRVMIDGIGECYSWPPISRSLRRHGVRVARFLPPRLLPPSFAINMRNHHKLLVIDQDLAFTGGMNIGDRHLVGRPGNRHPTADVHFRIRGPVVAQMRQEFLRLWRFATGCSEPLATCEPERAGSLLCRTLTDGPDEDLDRLTMLLTAAIGEAQRSIRIMTPYFLPPRELIGALQAAAIRGVAVSLVLPERSNLRYVDWATRNMLWEVLFHGVQVHYQPPPFNHAKLFVVDEDYSLIGSANWDPRSLRLNFELQVEVYGEPFAAQLSAYIDRAANSGRAVSLDEVDGRGLAVRFRDSVCWLFTPYL